MTLNRLRNEKSPYLLQHAGNPVDWYPWGAEAFSVAEVEDKPVFVSIGYSTCHWCHVMAHESFEDSEVGALLNDAFVCIKVDREERPDVDSVYMNICQMMTGSGGWPLTIIMTPDKKPFFAATYIPKTNIFGSMGLIEIIRRIKELWQHKKAELAALSDNVINAIESASSTPDEDALNMSTIEVAYDQLLGSFDWENGGFSTAPKFPAPHNLLFLMLCYRHSNDPNTLEMLEKTLTRMRMGGIFDQIGFGFHRYSTDAQWLVPHFEKMLYDQAMLAIAYAAMFQITGKQFYKSTLREILAYVLRELTDEEGGFYCAEDADAEGQEGKFYVWRYDEFKETLDEKELEFALSVFNIRKEGNFHNELTQTIDGRNILHLTFPLTETAKTFRLSEADFSDMFSTVVSKLFEKRRQRIAPFKDTKVLTDWNGLMIAALAKTAKSIDDPMYIDAAKKAADFILKNMLKADGRLLHRYKDGHCAIEATLDDYAFLIYGLIELYESGLDRRYLDIAMGLNKVLIDDFWDHINGGFYMTSANVTELPIRPKEIYDGAYPSGNSIALSNLLKLRCHTPSHDLQLMTQQLMQGFAGKVKQSPAAYTMFLIGIDSLLSTQKSEG